MIILDTRDETQTDVFGRTHLKTTTACSMTYWIVLRVHGLSEGFGVLTLKYVVEQTLALLLPGVSVRQHLYRALENMRLSSICWQSPISASTDG